MANDISHANASNGGLSPGQEYLRAAERVINGSFESEEERSDVLLKTYEMMGRIETPWETYVRVLANQPALTATFKVMKDLRVFELWNKQGNEPMTASQVAGLVDGKADPALLHRLLRLLASNHLVEQVPMGRFKPGRFCMELNTHISPLLEYYCNASHRVFGKMPAALADMGYKNPSDGKDTIFQHAMNWKGDLWSFMKQNPVLAEHFNMVQKNSTIKEPSWMGMYPHQKMVAEADPSLPLFVDVGGGIGHDLMRLHDAYPETASRLYLADLPAVIAENIVPASIKKVDYDFFTPQPVKHAKAYYLHHIIHDWSDEPARKILEMQKTAMKPGYSRLLIHDQILDDEKSQMNTAAFDILMMVYLAGMERTEKQWLALLNSVGLKVVNFWKKPPDNFSIIEVELPSSKF
ncbi:o-methyltransferase [Colletotrichum plurivorum]|uniref:O-methyltransferase n=1 Tax=Colletotrichum plurivorum TaxID=2175906 RepID=A0A8H6KLV5_9PEZI|nr:o-methyltransferase [Colletotrichum plurivorum]